MEEIVYDGVDITQRYTAVVTHRGLPSVDAETEKVPGMDGLFLRGSDLTPPTIGFAVIVDGDAAERRAAFRELAGILLVDGPVDVSFGSDGGLTYRAVIDGELDVAEFVSTGRLMVSMQAVEAAMRGETKSAAGTAGGSVTIDVGGTYPTPLKVSSSSATRSSDYLYGVRMDNRDYMRAELPVATCAVEFDAEARTVTANRTAGQLTLASDWLIAAPGRHTVRNDVGSGAFTVEWTERWL